MISLAEAELLAAPVLALMEMALKAVDPKLEAKIETFLPTAEKVAAALTKPDPATIQAELVSLQMDAFDRLAAAQIAASTS